jgi:hypothetical protein
MKAPAKIFPRNLTAHAGRIVDGNPVNSRPESGVDTSAPGLEFDQRNIEAAFFPGLEFEFHPLEGARLARIADDPRFKSIGFTADAMLGASAADAKPDLYLLCLAGRTALDQDADNPPVIYFSQLDGLEIWSRLRQVLDEDIAIMIGAHPRDLTPNDQVSATLRDYRKAQKNTLDIYPVVGPVAFLSGRRRTYLADGVIDPSKDGYAPGELTRTMCIPWQYDFRECGCFYWASNRPDLVTVAGSPEPHNFLGKEDGADSVAPPPADPLKAAAEYQAKVLGRWDVGAEHDHQDIVEMWHRLPLVIGGRKVAGSVVQAPPPAGPVLDRPGVIQALTGVAEIEHALLVEYLYALYTLRKVPPGSAEATSPAAARIAVARDIVYRIALDEMRHFRWANEGLALLGAAPTVKRAERIPNMDPPPKSERAFERARLTFAQLDRLIQAERASQSDEQEEPRGIDGIYVGILRSLTAQPDLFAEAAGLAKIVKTIIDEGEAHHRSLLSVRALLDGLEEDAFLRTLAPGAADLAEAVDMSNDYYASLLRAIAASFQSHDKGAGGLIARAVRSMRNMHEVNELLAARGADIPFAPPAEARLVAAPPGRSLLVELEALDAALPDMLARLSRG